MPNKSSIEWTDYTSNPIVPVQGGWGCSKVSPGCDYCYAEVLNKRWGNKRDFRGHWQFVLKDKELTALRKLKGSWKIFVGDMTDLFHEDVPWELLCSLFDVLDELRQHFFQLLTKRPGRMAYFAEVVWPLHKLGKEVNQEQLRKQRGPVPGYWQMWPQHIWPGTSVETQKYAPRLEALCRVPAKVRFVSAEPLLGPLDLSRWLVDTKECTCGQPGYSHDWECGRPWVQQVIAGGESGNKTKRTCHPVWVRSLRDQCQAAGVAFFWKQWGSHLPLDQKDAAGNHYGAPVDLAKEMDWVKLGKGKAGAHLDGFLYQEFPDA